MGWNYFVVLSRLSHGSSFPSDVAVGNKRVCRGLHVARDLQVERVGSTLVVL